MLRVLVDQAELKEWMGRRWWPAGGRTSQLPLRPLATTGRVAGYSGVLRQAVP